MRIFSLLTRKETRRFNFRHVTRAAQGGPDPGLADPVANRQPRRQSKSCNKMLMLPRIHIHRGRISTPSPLLPRAPK